MKAPRLAALVGGALVVTAVITGCNNPINAGAAATVGSAQIAESTVTENVNAVLEVQGKAPNTPNATLTQNTITRLVLTELLDQVAAENGIEISQGELDQTRAAAFEQSGGEEGVRQSLAQQGIPFSQLDSVIKLNLIISALSAKQPADGATDPSQLAFDMVQKRADEIGVQVNPRFGTWDASKLKLGPLPNDLSVPIAS